MCVKKVLLKKNFELHGYCAFILTFAFCLLQRGKWTQLLIFVYFNELKNHRKHEELGTLWAFGILSG